MTVEEVRQWAADSVANGEEPIAFYLGALDATRGEFNEADCAAAGFWDETPYCEGGREALLRMEQTTPAGRMAHGTIVGG